MKLKSKFLTFVALSGAAFVSVLSAQDASATMPSAEEMWRIIQAQQKQIDSLTKMVQSNQQEVSTAKSELASAKQIASSAQAEASSTRKALKNTQAQLEATTLAVEESSGAFTSGWWERTSIGGYGELHANFYDNSGANEVDFHRFVLFVNHDFNDWISLYSEIEIEHTSLGDTSDGSSEGEVKLEQAFVRLNWTENSSTDAGLLLMPVGILNDYHEPNTFFGVERNDIESNIIPTTWFEAGVRHTHRFGNGLSLEGGIVSGLNIASAGDNAFRIRSGREAVAKAPAEEPGFVSRVRFTGIAGLELAASVFYQDDLAQEDNDVDFSGLLSSAHLVYTYRGFTFKALYAQWNLSGDVVPSDAETQYGWFIEPSYRWNISERYGDLGVFARYSDLEYYQGGQRENQIIAVGANWWPTNNVVFKVDFESYDNGTNNNDNGNDHSVNLGVGYQF
ncbi:MAG TPA: porin [Opitutae bacterium]|nr:porin [Opitutae bacterium]